VYLVDLVSKEEVTSFVSDLVRINSVTPWLIVGGAGEAEIAAYFADWVSDLPVEVELQEIEPSRFNFIARLRGTGEGPTLLLNAHCDTVGFAGWTDEALKPRVDGDRLYGLGAADDKACCAIALLALRHFATRSSPLRGDLVIACVADEEGASIGTEHLLKSVTADFGIVLEADLHPRVVTQHQGFGWLDVVVNGRASHGSTPDVGVDAIVGLAEVVSRMRAFDLEHFAAHPDPHNGRTVFHTGVVRGGTDYATYPSRAEVGIEIGTQPGETLQRRVHEIEAMIDDVAALMPGLSGEVRVRLEREPFIAEGHDELLAALRRATREERGLKLDEVGMNAWTDAALMQAAGIPTVMLGLPGDNFHSPNEWVSIPEVVTTLHVLVGAINELLG